MVSLIVSFVLHFALLQTKVGAIGVEKVIIFPSKEEEIQIPIEFIPATQTVTARQYTVGELEAMKKMVTEAGDTKTLQKPRGTYSLNRTRSAFHRYLLAVREEIEIEKNKYLSTSSRYSRLVGNVKIGFSISSDGVFSNIQIVDSSGDQRLDRNALSAINSASGKTKRPKNTGIKTIKTSAVIKYQYGL